MVFSSVYDEKFAVRHITRCVRSSDCHVVFNRVVLLSDMVNSVKPDERSVMAYVSSYYHAFSGAQQVSPNLKILCSLHKFLCLKYAVPLKLFQYLRIVGCPISEIYMF